MRVFVLGYPGGLGGASTELWHVLKLWRSRNVDVTLVPTWSVKQHWQARCESIGVPTVRVRSERGVAHVPGLAGSLVIGFCNNVFLRLVGLLRDQDCQLAWANCMTWLFENETAIYAKHGPCDAYVFQSRHQQSVLFPQLAPVGVQPGQCFQIPGAFDLDEAAFKPRPHQTGSEFIAGRLARADPDKWHADMWRICNDVPYRPLQVRLMGWRKRIERKLGPPPGWADVLSPEAEPTPQFLGSLHCLLAINGGAQENWPRIGLEAMAHGVPVVAEDAWGWQEMIEDRSSGLLAATSQEFSRHVGELAKNEHLRNRIARTARERLRYQLADPDRIWQAWSRLFEHVSR